MLTQLLCTAFSVGAATVVEQWCPSESVSTVVACPGGCSAPVRHVRATEVNGTRHLMWTLNAAFPNTLYTARQESDGAWTYTSFTGPGGALARELALDGQLLAVAWASQVDLFRLIDGAWTPEATLTNPAPNFGASVAVWSPPGGPERVVVGAAVTLSQSGAAGSVVVYRKDAGWIVEQQIAAPTGLAIQATFGRAVAIDGERVAVSAPFQGPDNGPNGPISIYERIGGTWTASATIAVPAWLYPALGNRIALRGETLAAVDSNMFSFVGSLFGQAFVQLFQHVDGAWTPTDWLMPEGVATVFGYDVSLHADGEDVIATVAALKDGSAAGVLTGTWQYRLRQGFTVDSLRLRNPKLELNGADSSTPAASFVPAAIPWAALAAPSAIGGSAIRIVEPNSCPPTADLNGDGIVNGADLGILLGNWGNPGIGDLNGDGVVNGADLGILLGAWS